MYKRIAFTLLLMSILSGVALGVHVLTRHTPFGRYLYAIGGNEDRSGDLDVLRRLGLSICQGYLFARPSATPLLPAGRRWCAARGPGRC